MSNEDERKALRPKHHVKYFPYKRSLSYVTPGTFVHIDKDKNQLFAEYSVEGVERIFFGGCSTILDCGKHGSNPQLSAVFVDFGRIYYVDDKKELHDCMSFHCFFSTKDLAGEFVRSLPDNIHVYSASKHYKQTHFWGKNDTEVYLLTKTRDECIDILNRVFAFPEARPQAARLFESHYFGLERGVCAYDIRSLNAPETLPPETPHDMAATSSSTPISLTPPGQADFERSLSNENTASEPFGDTNNHGELVESAQPESPCPDEHDSSDKSRKSLLKNSLFSQKTSHPFHPEPEVKSLTCDGCLVL